MAILETKPAAYKSVSFLMITSRIAGGRKDVLFEFPNSNKQTVEDLGLRPRAYSMKAVIPHENYIETRDALLRVLEDGKKGPLDHPFYGRVENVVARAYSINERLSELGRAELELSFTVSDNIGVPQKSRNAISEASFLNDAVADAVAADIANTFEVDEEQVGNFSDAQDLLGGVSDACSEVTSYATAATDKINAYAAQINAFSTSINDLITVPQNLANSVKGIFSAANGLFSTAQATYDAFANLTFFDFGSNDVTINKTTQGRIQRAQNRDVMNQAMQAFALSHAYLNGAQVAYETVDDIDAVSTALDNQYIKIVSAQELSDAGLSATSFNALAELRTVVNKLLDDKRLQSRKIITVNTKKMPMSVIAYRYYGDTSLTETLLKLNNIKGACFVEGAIQILTE